MSRGAQGAALDTKRTHGAQRGVEAINIQGGCSSGCSGRVQRRCAIMQRRGGRGPAGPTGPSTRTSSASGVAWLCANPRLRRHPGAPLSPPPHPATWRSFPAMESRHSHA